MNHAKSHFFLLSQVIIWLSLTATAFGQATPPKPLSETEFTAMLQSRLKQVDDLTELDDAAKAKVKELYQQALTEMQAAKRWTATTAQNEKLASEAPKELQQTKAALATLPAQPMAAIPPEATLPQIEQAISKREAELEKLRKALADDETAIKGGTSWRAKLSEQISAAKERATKLGEQLQLPPPSDESPAMNTARRMVLVARRRTAEQEIACCETQQRAYEARTELLPLHRDLLARQVGLAEQEIKQWQELVNRRRQQEAEQQAQQASWQAGQAHPAVQGLVKENADVGRHAERVGRAHRRHHPPAGTSQPAASHPDGPVHARPGKGGGRRKNERHQRRRPAAAEATRRAAQPSRVSPQHQRPAADDRRGSACAATIAG